MAMVVPMEACWTDLQQREIKRGMKGEWGGGILWAEMKRRETVVNSLSRGTPGSFVESQTLSVFVCMRVSRFARVPRACYAVSIPPHSAAGVSVPSLFPRCYNYKKPPKLLGCISEPTPPEQPQRDSRCESYKSPLAHKENQFLGVIVGPLNRRNHEAWGFVAHLEASRTGWKSRRSPKKNKPRSSWLPEQIKTHTTARPEYAVLMGSAKPLKLGAIQIPLCSSSSTSKSPCRSMQGLPKKRSKCVVHVPSIQIMRFCVENHSQLPPFVTSPDHAVTFFSCMTHT